MSDKFQARIVDAIPLASVIDSVGAGVLSGVCRKLPRRSAGVVLRVVQSGIPSVLELLRLHRALKVQ